MIHGQKVEYIEYRRHILSIVKCVLNMAILCELYCLWVTDIGFVAVTSHKNGLLRVTTYNDPIGQVIEETNPPQKNAIHSFNAIIYVFL